MNNIIIDTSTPLDEVDNRAKILSPVSVRGTRELVELCAMNVHTMTLEQDEWTWGNVKKKGEANFKLVKGNVILVTVYYNGDDWPSLDKAQKIQFKALKVVELCARMARQGKEIINK